LLRAWL